MIYVRTAGLATADDRLTTQRALANLPRLWGWPGSRIRIIDRDSGLPGTSVANRRGFQHLSALIRRERVGLVLVQDVTRLSRNPGELAAFLTDAMRAGVAVFATAPVLHDLIECQYSAINGGGRLE